MDFQLGCSLPLEGFLFQTPSGRSTRTKPSSDRLISAPLQVDFQLGYSLPLEGFLFQTASGRRHLAVNFSSPLQDVYVDQLEVRVVLPEGAANEKWSLPFPVQQSRCGGAAWVLGSGICLSWCFWLSNV